MRVQEGGMKMDVLLVKRAQRRDMEAFVELMEKHKTSLYKVAKSYLRSNLRVAAVAAIVCFAVPSMAYASVESGFFEAMFGNTTKKSSEVIHTEVDTGKGSKESVDIPSKEFVPVDGETAEEMIGPWVMEKPITKKIGEHTLTSDFMFQVMYGEPEDEDFIFSGENIYIDLEKSTDELLYCSSYILWSGFLEEGRVPKLVITKYPDTLGNLNKLLPDTTNMSEQEMSNPALYAKYEEAMAKAQTETIELSDKGQVPVKEIDLGENGYLMYSPMAISIDLSKGLGLSKEEAYDPWNLDSLVIKYKDGSEYVVSDREKLIENSGYQVGGVDGGIDTCYSTVFNRLVDTGEIAEIIVNGVSFPAE